MKTQRKWRRDASGESEGAGYDFFHVAVDDATRLAYVEVLPDERRASTTGFLVRALRRFRHRGVRVERVMTDNGSGYVARLFRKTLRMLAIRHIQTRLYTPKTNGKAERFSNRTRAVKSGRDDRPFLGGHASLRARLGGT